MEALLIIASVSGTKDHWFDSRRGVRFLGLITRITMLLFAALFYR
jgi:hypothetical protein